MLLLNKICSMVQVSRLLHIFLEKRSKVDGNNILLSSDTPIRVIKANINIFRNF